MTRMRRRLAATAAMAFVLGCSLRNLDDLSNGSAPSDSGAPPADTVAPARPDGGGAGAGQRLFWVDSGDRGVHSAGVDGSGARVLLTLPTPSYLRSIAVDAVHRKLYFTDSGLKKIQSANLDGTGAADLVTGLDTPVGIDLDVANGKVYFADQGAKPAILRANLDGSGKETIVATGLMHPYGVAVDRTAARLYFVDNRVQGVFRSALDGSAMEKLPIAGVTDPIELTIDTQASKLYWTELGPPPRIRRANLDGTGAEDVVTQARQPTLSTPLGVSIDLVARKLYWVDGGGGSLDVIQRAELDGSDVRPVVVGLSAPRGLSILP